MKQYLLTPTCLNCGSFFLSEALFCKCCFKEIILRPYKKNRNSHLAQQHFYLIEWTKGESAVLSQMVYSLKSDNAVPALRFYAKLFLKKIKNEIHKEQFDAIIPIPGSNKKSVHSLILAEEVSKILGIPIKDVLIKSKEHYQQKKMTAEERKLNRNIILKNEQNEHFTKCLLIDDIVTTGESFFQACSALNSKQNNVILSLFYRPRWFSNEKAF